MVALLWSTVASAQKSAIQMEEERAKRCPEGQYSGPHEGARRYYKDPYAWFVSREFAKRFCMPDSYVDDSLKGALALAVRIKPEAFNLCGFIGGPSQCPIKYQLLFDVFVDNKAVTIPKVDSTVTYYSGAIDNSGSKEIMGTGLAIDGRRRRGELTDMEGERRPFSPLGKDTASWIRFQYLALRNGIADSAGLFIERYYRSNWVAGIDLITLDSMSFGYSMHLDPRKPVWTHGDENMYPQIALDRTNPVRGWAIGVINDSDMGRVGKRAHMGVQYAIPYPESYVHTIELPRRVVEIIYAYDHHEGEKLFDGAKNAIQRGGSLESK